MKYLVRTAPDVKRSRETPLRPTNLDKTRQITHYFGKGQESKKKLTAYKTAPKMYMAPWAMIQLMLMRSSSPAYPYIDVPWMTGMTPERPSPMNMDALYGRHFGVRKRSTHDTVAHPMPKVQIYSMLVAGIKQTLYI